jgi:hypothetical protein
MAKRYEQFPEMARLVRVMSPEGRELVAHWHRVLLTALEGAVPQLSAETVAALKDAGFNEQEAHIGSGSAQGALEAWLKVMRDVAAIVSDPSKGDWCCKRGMMVSPNRCPQHGFDPKVKYELGTIIQRQYGESRERAVMVRDDSESPHPWVSVEFPLRYNWSDLYAGQWTVVGRV